MVRNECGRSSHQQTDDKGHRKNFPKHCPLRRWHQRRSGSRPELGCARAAMRRLRDHRRLLRDGHTAIFWIDAALFATKSRSKGGYATYLEEDYAAAAASLPLAAESGRVAIGRSTDHCQARQELPENVCRI